MTMCTCASVFLLFVDLLFSLLSSTLRARSSTKTRARHLTCQCLPAVMLRLCTGAGHQHVTLGSPRPMLSVSKRVHRILRVLAAKDQEPIRGQASSIRPCRCCRRDDASKVWRRDGAGSFSSRLVAAAQGAEPAAPEAGGGGTQALCE
jgi:hypothetical protein